MARNKRILVVDDEQNMRASLAALLEEEGHAVTTAASGEEAVKLCSEHRYDVALIDLRMPGLGGLAAFRKIRRQQQDAALILMSAYSTGDLEQQAIREGARAFVGKPLDINALLKVLGELEQQAPGAR